MNNLCDAFTFRLAIQRLQLGVFHLSQLNCSRIAQDALSLQSAQKTLILPCDLFRNAAEADTDACHR